ncbi:MAG: 16S rRNA (cytidine(1402)-2'-O)-methyltransferase [Verrucomicrobiota bacterium]|nr:MAG: 16S rRNA (cytidine(1402)-2'-O)-methyltransferase [Verrucomicrobiota bacterium]
MATGTLFVVATPIGNLNDLSPRAAETLRCCTTIACEDTRVSKKVFQNIGVTANLIAYHDLNEITQAVNLVQKLRDGENLAVVCDAGTPTVSDPGFRIVRECQKIHIPVVPIPGPNAAITALSASGLPTNRFLFLGFPGHKQHARLQLLEEFRNFNATLIFYESCYRVEAFLQDIAHVMGPQRVISVAKELTKLHETILTGTASDLLLQLPPLKGEFAVLIAPPEFVL